MDDDVIIRVAGSSTLPDETRSELVRVLGERGQALVEEAGRIEAAANPTGASPMITPAMITHAHTGQMLGFVKARMSRASRYFLLASTMTTFVGGIFINNVDEVWGAIGAIVCGVAAVILFIKGAE